MEKTKISKIENYCTEIRNLLENKNPDIEQVKKVFTDFTCFVQGYLIACENNIEELQRKIALSKKDFSYARNIEELQEKITSDIKLQCQANEKLFKEIGDQIMAQIFNLLNKRLCDNAEKYFYNYRQNEIQLQNEKGRDINE